jgi:hypothetical protein
VQTLLGRSGQEALMTARPQSGHRLRHGPFVTAKQASVTFMSPENIFVC